MKLYTEEQVREILMSIDTNIYISDSYIDSKIESLTPIELPSDEEMEKELLEHTKVSTIDPYKSFYFNAAMFGAKWVIEQIKQQDGKE
jgi:hypothetical protein